MYVVPEQLPERGVWALSSFFSVSIGLERVQRGRECISPQITSIHPGKESYQI